MAVGPDYRYTTGAPGWGRVATADAAAVDAGLRAHMLRVYNWMASGLLLTGIVALAVATQPAIQELFWQVGRTASGYRTVAPNLLRWVAILSPLAFVLVLSFGYNRLSKGTAQALFWAFSVCMGLSLSQLALLSTGTSLASAFFVPAGMYPAVRLSGYPPQAGLTRMGSFMVMGLIGL